MIDEPVQFERELRTLYAEVAPPPAPKAWNPERQTRPAVPSSAGSRAAWRPGGWRVAALVATVALVAIVGVVSVRPATVSVPPAAGVTISLRPAAASLSCKLPISALSNDHTTGFIVMDHGRATFEPVQTEGTTYIPALATWAHVLPQMVAPDGHAYVSQHYSGGHAITLTDAKGTRTLLDNSAHIGVVAYTTAGILVTDRSGYEPTILAFKLLDPNTGALRAFPFAPLQLPAGRNLMAGYMRSSNAVWLTVADAGATPPGPTPAAPRGGTTVSRYDLATGETTEWLSSGEAPGVAQVVGADQTGAPIVQVAERDVFHTDPAHRAGIAIQTLLVTSPHRVTVLNRGRVGEPGVAGAFSPLSVTDGNAIWLASDDGAIWLHRPSDGLQQVAKVTTSPRGSPGVAISGPCS